MKLLSSNTDHTESSFCLTLWTCRPSREGLHAFCNKPQVSKLQHRWIARQFKSYGQTKNDVQQNVDYRRQGCFPNPTREDKLFKDTR